MTARYIVRRLGWSLLTLWAVATLVFLIFHALPGNPVSVLVSPFAGAAARQTVIRQLGLNRPLYVQYALYLGGLAHGDLGTSFTQRMPVSRLLGPAFANTFVLALTTFLCAYVIGAFLGVIVGWRRGSGVERAVSFVALVLRGAPIFWLGVVAIIVLGLGLHWFPVAGISSRAPAPTGLRLYLSGDFLRHLALPLMSSVLYALGLPLILMRNSILDVLHEGFVDLARAKGVGEWRVMLLHGARNALLPLIAESSQFLGWAMGGLVTIEYVFSWPGLGYELITALSQRDYPLGEGCFLAIAVMVIVLNFLGDVVTAWLDPRVVFA